MEEFKRLPDDERQAAAQKIIDMFIDNKAPSQVNLKSQQFKRINTRFAAGDVAVDLFDEGQAEVREVCSKPTARVAQQQQIRCLPLTNHNYTRARWWRAPDCKNDQQGQHSTLPALVWQQCASGSAAV